jgi:hypothetical protein
MSTSRDSADDQPRKKCGWSRFSLRTLLICVTLFCVLSGWFATKLHQSEQQRVAVEKLRAVGCIVGYDWETNPNDSVNLSGHPPGPQWLRDWLGPDFLDTVVSTSLRLGGAAHPIGDREFE